MQAAPALLLHMGKPVDALERYRSILCAIESQGISHVRLKLMCHLAELLLHGSAGDNYKAPIEIAPQSSPWKPKQYAALNQVNN